MSVVDCVSRHDKVMDSHTHSSLQIFISPLATNMSTFRVGTDSLVDNTVSRAKILKLNITNHKNYIALNSIHALYQPRKGLGFVPRDNF